MATTYPNATFIGVDILQTFPSEIKPDNVEFMLGNVISGLNFESNSFDYIFVRQMKFAIPINDWPNVLDELLRVLKPNSWLEIVDNVDQFICEDDDKIKKHPNDKIKEYLNNGIFIFMSIHIYI